MGLRRPPLGLREEEEETSGLLVHFRLRSFEEKRSQARERGRWGCLTEKEGGCAEGTGNTVSAARWLGQGQRLYCIFHHYFLRFKQKPIVWSKRLRANRTDSHSLSGH